MAVLLLGRRLFWLFVAAAGFAAGLAGARAVLGPEPEWLAVLAAVGIGLVGAILAVAFQWLAVGVGGFLAGSYVALSAARLLGAEGAWLWAAAVAGGIVAAALLVGLLDWVLIVLSALVGGALLTSLVDAAPLPATLLFVALVAAGVLVQGRVLAPPPRAPAR
jgi:hypothetical protein